MNWFLFDVDTMINNIFEILKEKNLLLYFNYLSMLHIFMLHIFLFSMYSQIEILIISNAIYHTKLRRMT